MNRIPVVIPSYEPDENLTQLCIDLKNSGISDILVVDDGSGEEYRSIFKEVEEIIQRKVLVHPVNKGKGAALKTAFTFLLEDEDVLGCVTADSDGQHTPKDILSIISALKNHPKDLILGARNIYQEDVPARNAFGNRLSVVLYSIFAGVKVSDTQTGLRGISRDFMRDLLEVKENRFEFETKMLILTRKKIKIFEVPIQTIYAEKENYHTHFNPFKDSVKIMRVLFKEFFVFILSSLSSFGLDIFLFYLFGLWTASISQIWDVTIATVLARIISATYNYLMNYYFVFSSDQKKGKSFTRYALLALVQLTLSATLITILAYLFPTCNQVFLKVVIDSILFLISYQIQRQFVF